MPDDEILARLSELEQSERQLLIYAQDLRRSHEELRAQLRMLTALHSVNLAIAAALDVDSVARETLEGVVRLLDCDGAAIYVADAEGEPFRLRAVIGGLAGGELPDLVLPERAESFLRETGAVANAALRAGQRLVGILRVRRAARPFDPHNRQLLELVAAQAGVGLQNAQVFELTHAQAITDGLTGLFNHRYFDQFLVSEVERASRLNYPVGLLMTDLDRFKAVNDTLGHQTGDELLRQIAAAVTTSVRKTDLVARYGGDEIAIILPGCRRQSLAHVAEKVRSAAERVARRLCQAVPVTVSVGGAMFPEDARTATDLVSSADRALYQVKAGGGNRVFIANDPAD